MAGVEGQLGRARADESGNTREENEHERVKFWILNFELEEVLRAVRERNFGFWILNGKVSFALCRGNSLDIHPKSKI